MINVGVVGCGYWGSKHIRVFSELEGAVLRMVCDPNTDAVRKARAQYPTVATTSDLRELLASDIDAVVVATPVSTHYEVAKKALEYEKHVLVEKPITSNSREALELINLAEQRDRVLMVGHTFMYHPAVDFLRQLVQSGELGQVYYIDTARLNLGLLRPDINVLWDLAPHDTSIVLYLLDKDPIAVSGRAGRYLDPDLHDVAYMELVFPGQVMAHVHVSWLDPCKVRRVTVVGSRKMAVYNDVSEGEKIRVYDKGVTKDCNTDSLSGWPPSYRFGDVTIPFISNTEPLKIEGRDFLSCIAEGKRPRSDGWWGLRVVNILETVTGSISNGGLHQQVRAAAVLG